MLTVSRRNTYWHGAILDSSKTQTNINSPATNYSTTLNQERKPMKPSERFEAKYIPEPFSGCWLWTAACSLDGYGRFWYAGKYRTAHSASFLLHGGIIPEGYDVCHTCDVVSCVNPAHLWVGTRRDNVQDAVKKNRFAKGELSGNSKLTRSQVIAIRNSREPQRAIAKKLRVSQHAIWSIRTHRTWTNI